MASTKRWASVPKSEFMAMSKPRIIIDPEILGGKPVIAGTRITVALILERLAEGRSVAQIVDEYPHLTRKQVVGAIQWARACVERTEAAE